MPIKYGVSLKDLVPQMALADSIVREVYRRFEPTYECTITSGNDSKHSQASLHYQGRALDYRTKDFAGDKQALIKALKEALGQNFDVLLEDEGGVNEHAHIEHDPKEVT